MIGRVMLIAGFVGISAQATAPTTPSKAPEQVAVAVSAAEVGTMLGLGAEARSNYLGYYFRWGSEGGTCVGGADYNQNPDLMDAWLKGDGVDDVYLGETGHGTAAGCAYHQGNWWNNSLLSTSCDGGQCAEWMGNLGYIEEHVHHAGCSH